MEGVFVLGGYNGWPLSVWAEYRSERKHLLMAGIAIGRKDNAGVSFG